MSWTDVTVPAPPDKIASKWTESLTRLFHSKEKKGCTLFKGTIHFNFIPGLVYGNYIRSELVEKRLEHFWKELNNWGMKKGGKNWVNPNCFVVVFEIDKNGVHAHFSIAYRVDLLRNKWEKSFKKFWEGCIKELCGGVRDGKRDVINTVWLGGWDGSDAWLKYMTKSGLDCLGSALYYGDISRGGEI